MKERKACWSEDPREDAGSEIEKNARTKKESLSVFLFYIVECLSLHV